MKKPFKLALGAIIGFGIFTGGALAAAPVEDGSELVTVCKALMTSGAQEGSEGERCCGNRGMVRRERRTRIAATCFKS